MPKLIPPRPRYRREWLIVGWPTFAAFALLFASRLLGRYLSLSGKLWYLLLTTAVSLALPTLIFWLLRGKGYGKAMRLRRPRTNHIPFLIAAFFALFSGAMLLSMLFGGTSSLGNSTFSFESADTSRFFYAAALFLLVAVLPALLEELFFRGILVVEYERRGAVRALLMSALLFSLCHYDLRNLPVYLFSGFLFLLVLYATDSLLSSIILHLVYNTVSLFGQRYLNALYSFTGSLEFFIFLMILIFIVSMLFFAKCGATIYRRRAEEGLPDPRRAVPRNVQLYTILDALSDPPILLCFILSIIGFILL